MGSSCCAKDRAAKAEDLNLPVTGDIAVGTDKPAEDYSAKPNPLQKPQEPDPETVFLERANFIKSSNPDVNVLVFFYY